MSVIIKVMAKQGRKGFCVIILCIEAHGGAAITSTVGEDASTRPHHADLMQHITIPSRRIQIHVKSLMTSFISMYLY